MPFRTMMIDATEPALWVAIGVASVAALLLGRSIGVRAGRITPLSRAVGLAGLDLVVLVPFLLILELVLLFIVFAVQTGGASACIPLVRQLLLIPPAVGIFATTLTWYRARDSAHASPDRPTKDWS